MALEFRRELGGRPLVLEFGELAQQANGSVLVRCETVVLVTVTMSEPRQGIDFSSSCRLRRADVCRGTNSWRWGRREGRPSENAI